MTVRVVRPVRTGAIGALVAAAVTATLLITPAEAAGTAGRGTGTGTGTGASDARAGASDAGSGVLDADSGRPHTKTRAALDAAVDAGVPGATARVVDKHGVWRATSGLGDLKTGAPRGAHDRYRVGSVTKTFVATVLLQLQGEHRIDLDDPVERWLPGLVRGEGYDARRITVRHLLNHTSGIADFLEDREFADTYLDEDFLDHRYDSFTPGQLVATGVRNKARFDPGEGWEYSNTNYVLAALIIERITGRPYGEEIQRRIIKPLGLHATSVPGTESTLPEPSSRGYATLGNPDGTLHDVTELNPSGSFGSGEMISDSRDLTRFYSALLRGRLIPREQLAEMLTTVPAGPAADYGLGLQRWRTSCGAPVWGHGGEIHGSLSVALTSPDGRHSLAFNFNGAGDWQPVANAEFCGR
ncbi:serine hydrolase [Streptomyces sp. N35]|uniref:serine hydrolase domain-containing protein n=1 Tax=Streptomyces sp. N35 TaxID=2795730 RepID=UPI0018F2C33F|nr:serine hydrolase domain-containing protein [Streptomyces sp. N35]